MKPKEEAMKDTAAELVAEGNTETWRRPLAQTLVGLLEELDRRRRLEGEVGGLSSLELIGAIGKLSAIDVEAGSLLDD